MESMLTLDFSSSSNFKTLLRSRICFLLWHRFKQFLCKKVNWAAKVAILWIFSNGKIKEKYGGYFVQISSGSGRSNWLLL
ncbi:hypothetical protein AFM12_03690 [Jiulongibacter sediminis]|uniref:Uncharacterized protein n=1 Tax=Jiulongibacter sediminis TaxID=1605367 RepID=A0A0P7C7Z8_9BACT|nr:hypothetical protein AFM12_03690 [Jiulongibacter sediminis]TBX26738.1 hypothetical protein TK44_03695 [Jiulongibacter sediminis]